eukprot:3079121-Alexandrium_andersonii.AAC.1
MGPRGSVPLPAWAAPRLVGALHRRLAGSLAAGVGTRRVALALLSLLLATPRPRSSRPSGERP